MQSRVEFTIQNKLMFSKSFVNFRVDHANLSKNENGVLHNFSLLYFDDILQKNRLTNFNVKNNVTIFKELFEDNSI